MQVKKFRTRKNFTIQAIIAVAVMLVIAVTTIVAVVLSPGTKSHAAGPFSGPISGDAALQLDTQAHTLTFSFNIKNGPKNTAIMGHIHDGGCAGTLLWMLPANIQTDANGNASGSATIANVQDAAPSPNWFFNVHDQTITATTGKNLSIACGQAQVNGNNATAQLVPDPNAAAPANPLNPVPQAAAKSVGGLDLDAYCKQTGHANGVTQEATTANDWKCVDSNGAHTEIDTFAACKAQYPNAANVYAMYTDLSDAGTINCYAQ